jgi:hypothetical protein
MSESCDVMLRAVLSHGGGSPQADSNVCMSDRGHPLDRQSIANERDRHSHGGFDELQTERSGLSRPQLLAEAMHAPRKDQAAEQDCTTRGSDGNAEVAGHQRGVL